ncbi:hypothetical protein ABT346_29320 [Micromonospora peucetia]|uniref:hypothetical protein n=1 Tax=Micromonospora peucetia TaxID=47871 RepID=UPI003327FCB4
MIATIRHLDWVNRYVAGQQDRVWHEKGQLGSRVRESAFTPEAQAVCDEMARRARSNIETLVARLREQGYQSHKNDDDQTPTEPYTPPGSMGEEHLCWLEERLSPLPMVLSSWMRIVGDVWLVGTHPQWPSSAAADPLVLELAGSRYPDSDIREYFAEEIEAWQEDHDEPFLLPVAPDHFHKDNVSGGGPYGIILPDASADAHFVGEAGMPLVAYLNWVFQHGGFPRPTGAQAQWQVIHQLRAPPVGAVPHEVREAGPAFRTSPLNCYFTLSERPDSNRRPLDPEDARHTSTHVTHATRKIRPCSPTLAARDRARRAVRNWSPDERRRSSQPARRAPDQSPQFTCAGSCACRARGRNTRCTAQRWERLRTTACRALLRRTKNKCGSGSRSSLSFVLSPARYALREGERKCV